MTLLNYLSENMRWQLKQNPFDDLICMSTGKNQLVKQLHALSEKYFPDKKRIDTYQTEFCLNKIALSSPKTQAERLLKEQFFFNWTHFVRLKNIFARKYMYLPANADGTRLQQIATLVVKCTQCCINQSQLQKLENEIQCIFDLSPRERQYLDETIQLYRICHYCGLYATLNTIQIAKVLQPQLLKFDYEENDKYRQTVYRKGKLSAMVNCLGSSALSYGQKNLSYKQNLYVYCRGRNVFDTFTQSKLGTNTAEFRAETTSLLLHMQYFLTEFCQVKRYTLTNKSKAVCNYTIDISATGGEQLYVADQYTLADNDVYVATCVVCDNEIVECDVRQGVLTFRLQCKPQETTMFDVVTVASHNAEIVAREIALLSTYGRTRCDALSDEISRETTISANIVGLTSYGQEPRITKPQQSPTMHYSYRLGNDDVGTFADNEGNQTTLLNGFAFGKGESVFCLSNGKLQKLNCGQFSTNGQTLRYNHDFGCCAINHGNGKKYTVTYAKPCRTLFYFPLEEGGIVTKVGNTFTIINKLRTLEIICDGKIDSFTTNALECNEQRLRYKLSNNLATGTCLAVCFKIAPCIELSVNNCMHTPLPSPILRESLVSTYLNYLNGKNVFCLVNRLIRPDPLVLSAICYTNPQFVLQYLQAAKKEYPLYYDGNGQLTECDDKMLYPLAALYYATLVDNNFLTDKDKSEIQAFLLQTKIDGKALAQKALALKKAALSNGFDKVKLMVEYTNIKRTLTADTRLYAYAQAIGALPLLNPSKQRLKDLCRQTDVPQAWYYVSQIENLYGMTYAAGKLSFSPKVSNDNVLEQLAVTINGKRISTTFARSTVQSMTLNGVTHFQPFFPSKLTEAENTLIVNY